MYRAQRCLAPGFVTLLIVVMGGAATAGPDEAERNVLGAHVAKQYESDLESVLHKRYLRVLTSNNSFDYFIYQGRHAGYQYEMVREFTRRLNDKYFSGRGTLKIQFELLPVRSEQLIPMLLEGRADMIAARLTITSERAALVLFSDPYRKVDELLVAGQNTKRLRHLSDLAGRQVAVRKSSSYYESLAALSREFTASGKPEIRIETVDEDLETEDILALVAAGRFELSVADSIVAKTAVALFPELRIVPELHLRAGGELAWATRPGSAALQREMNEFLAGYRQGSLLGNVTTKKYFENHVGLQARIQADGKTRLSPYDDDFRRRAAQYGFDWRLLAAVAYQESRFEQSSRNRSGAVGLFQIKPSTAREPYIDIPDVAGKENASNNIRAGVKYLAWIKARYFDSVGEMRERDRVRMTLAAYNAGPRTLINAQRQARKMELDPTRWFRNVEMALLAMSKPEPVKYVSEINQRYLSYIMLGVE